MTLDAGTSVVISGTIQHDGPVNGAGGLRLLAPAGTVSVGTGGQSAGVAAGSRFGLTRVQARSLQLAGGGDPEAYAQLGYHAVNQGTAFAVTGAISITVGQNIMASGGSGYYSYARIGHGGANLSGGPTQSGSFSGPIAVDAGGDVSFQAGSGTAAYVQLGNGGDHRLAVGGDVTFQAGDNDCTIDGFGRCAQIARFGNGALFIEGNSSGNLSLSAGGNVTFMAGGTSTAAQFGNTGTTAAGNHNLAASGDMIFRAGWGVNAYAQFGNTGESSASGSHSLTVGGDVLFLAGGDPDALGDNCFKFGGCYVHFGNGGWQISGNFSGSHSLTAVGNVTFQAGAGSYAHFGNGSLGADGDDSGSHSLTAGGIVTFRGGSGLWAYAQFGNGANGNHSGNLALASTGNLNVAAGSGVDAYAIIGHGADMRLNLDGQGTGSRAGDIMLRVGATAVFSGSQAGHLTASQGPLIIQGNTFLGVSQNNPFSTGPGQLLVTGVTATNFSSAPTANGGELRIYLPREDSQQIPTNAAFNGATFAVANTIPPAQLAGLAQFGDGPYIPDYSFYLAIAPTDLPTTAQPKPLPRIYLPVMQIIQ